MRRPKQLLKKKRETGGENSKLQKMLPVSRLKKNMAVRSQRKFSRSSRKSPKLSSMLAEKLQLEIRDQTSTRELCKLLLRARA